MPEPITPAPRTPTLSFVVICFPPAAGSAGGVADFVAGPSRRHPPEPEDGTLAAVTARDIAAVVGVTAVWGVAFVGIKEVLADAPALTVAGMRFLLGGLLLVPFARRARRSGRVVGRTPRLVEMAAVGLLQTTLLYGLGFLGIQRATAGTSALLLNTNPVLVAVLAVPLLRDRLRMTAMTGLALAVAGVALISVRSGLGTPSGVVLLLLGAVSWACGSILIKRL